LASDRFAVPLTRYGLKVELVASTKCELTQFVKTDEVNLGHQVVRLAQSNDWSSEQRLEIYLASRGRDEVWG
jgi:hypothetical protein